MRILKVFVTCMLLSLLQISSAQILSAGWLPFGRKNSASDVKAVHADDIHELLENVRQSADMVEATVDLFPDWWKNAFSSSFSSPKALPSAMLEKVPSCVKDIILY
eukprot:CAMPEP_0204627582 /NCGR_PEP_ID=MMETSP0717-20131115/14016_1 /ASSEMBLY_ACC=CAM_ASM_000666 /TAXON_ID=230516 /ORGANISM="Chaetoceros curvisetus" /LENGTH=105 /DNA_ID=CAMNT_0051643889 /DNA_START=29 /DNA_END=343 /DNA_ORIENTATION=+